MRIKVNDYDYPHPNDAYEFVEEYPEYYSPEIEFHNSKRISAAICPNCGTELYIYWTVKRIEFKHIVSGWDIPSYIRTRAMQLQEKYNEKLPLTYGHKDCEDKTCPVCGKVVESICFDAPLQCEQVEDAIQYAYERTISYIERYAVKPDVTQFLQSCDIPVATRFASGFTAKISPTGLQNYVFHLLQLESNIKSLSKHLEKLYCERKKNEIFVNQVNYAPTIEAMRKKEYAQTKYNQAKREYETKLKDAATCRNNKPVPVAIPEPAYKPTEPQYRKPGLFNKKKVLAENELLKAQYQQDQEKYELECQQLVLESKQKDKENHEKHLKSIQLAEKAAEKARLAMESLEVNPKDFIPGPPKEVCPAKVKHQIICTEIEKTQTLLRDTYKARNELYAANVIFPKYRDIVALASFYEYLMAGRCTGLEGPNGAYNLYEAEIRANMIISKLSEIEKSLKKIEQNQYMIYSQLTEMNRTLDTINSTMDRAYEKISDIQVNTQDMKQYMAHIAENSDVIAHNTAVTAYYSKLNAELTNALGFMVALK